MRKARRLVRRSPEVRGVGEQAGDLRGVEARARRGRRPALWRRAGGGGTGVRGLGRGPGGLPCKLGHQPVETVEVIAQPLFGVVLRVAQNADRPAVAAGTDGAQQLEVQGTLAQRQDLAAVAVALHVHSVQAERAQVGHASCRAGF